MVALFAIATPENGEPPPMGADWPTLVFALVTGVLAVAFSVWFVAWLRRRWTGHGPLLAKAARGSYATYVVHPLVLTLLMVMFSAVPIGPEVKFVVVAVLAVPASFAVGYALARLPGTSNVF
jgi:hypothetical protein